jgi:hypothetical protein
VPGDQQQVRQAGELLVVDPALGRGPVAVLADQRAQQVVAGVAPGPLHQACHVGTGGPDHLGALAGGEVGAQRAPGALLEPGAVGVGDAEQLADHQRGHGQGEVGDEVRGRPGGRHGFEGVVDDGGDPGLQRLHRPDREPRGEHPPQPGVVRRVQREQHPAAATLHLRRGELLGHPRRRWDSLEPERRVAVHRPGVVEPGHQVRPVAGQRRHRADPVVFAQGGDVGVGVQPVPAQAERRRGCDVRIDAQAHDLDPAPSAPREEGHSDLPPSVGVGVHW